jgi:carbamoyltransferase
VPFSAWELPFHAIDHCLAQAGVTLADLDHVAYSFDPRDFAGDRLGDEATITLPLEPSAHAAGAWDNPWDPLFAAYIVNAPRQLVDGAPHHLRKRFAGVKHGEPAYRWHFVNHHLCHQASAFLASPFERCAVMTLDGRGERATTTYGAYRDERYRPLGEVTMPHSLGLLYERITTHLGFLHSSDEYKVMALAALGRPEYRSALRDHVHVGADGRYAIDPIDMTALFGPPRERGAALLQRHFDLAASLQAVLEESVLKIAAWLRRASGEPHLAMAGGVALNCVMNARLRDSDIFEQVWVQPAAGDAGTALGAALWVDAEARAATPAPAAAASAPGPAAAPRRWQMEHAYLGPDYDDAAIERALQWAQLPHTRHATTEALAAATARLLLDNRIVGWFQGRMEFGPRALGARSILASPLSPDMQQRLNEIKDREDFRPVAPVVLEEEAGRWFVNAGCSPFMLFVYEVAPDKAHRIPAVRHVDGTARIQTVNRGQNALYYDLLKAFQRRTGVPVLVNTSFNTRSEPVVCTPRDAVECFWTSPIDALVIGSFVLEK